MFTIPIPSRKVLNLIASIVSTNIRKIAFVLNDCDVGVGWEYPRWSPLDAALSSMVDRLRASGYEHTLELEFQLEPEFADIDPRDDPDIFFPCFRKKGQVTILEKTSGRIIYCSGR